MHYQAKCLISPSYGNLLAQSLIEMKMKVLNISSLALAISIVSLSCSAHDYSVISTEDIEWGMLNPLRGDASPRAADLWGDRTKDTATGMLVKFKKGFSRTRRKISHYCFSRCRC